MSTGTLAGDSVRRFASRRGAGRRLNPRVARRRLNVGKMVSPESLRVGMGTVARFEKFRLGKFSIALCFDNSVDETFSCCDCCR